MKAIILAAALTIATLANGAEPKVTRQVNIGDLEQMEQFSKSDPEIFAKVQQLLHDIERRPPRNQNDWAKTNFGAESLIYTPMLMTSDPAKRYISFVIGDTRFAGTYELAQIERTFRAKRNAD